MVAELDIRLIASLKILSNFLWSL